MSNKDDSTVRHAAATLRDASHINEDVQWEVAPYYERSDERTARIKEAAAAGEFKA